MKKSLIMIISILLIGLGVFIGYKAIQRQGGGLEKNAPQNTGAVNIPSISGEVDYSGTLQKELLSIKNEEITLDPDQLEEITYVDSLSDNNGTLNILKYVETKDISYCDKIDNEDINFKNKIQNYCQHIFKNGSLDEDFINSFANKEDLSVETVLMYKNIINKTQDCGYLKGIYQYLLCKKFLDKNFPVKDTLIGYRKILSGNKNLVKANPQFFINGLGLEKDIEGPVISLIDGNDVN